MTIGQSMPPQTTMAPSTSHQMADAAPDRRRVVGLILVVLMALCIVFVVGYVQRLAEREAVAAEMAALEEQIAQAKVRNAILTTELAQVNDDAHIGAIARNALNLVQDGDQPLAIIDAPARTPIQPAGSPAAVRAPISTQPNWQRWVDLIVAGN